MSIYGTTYQARSRAPDYSLHLRDSKPKVSSILRANTNPSINERIHLVKEKADLKGLQISSTPDTKPLSKRTSLGHTPCRSSGILISKSSEIAKNYNRFPKPSHFLKKEPEVSDVITKVESPEELEKKRNWEICQAKLKERNPEAIACSPTLREGNENQKKLPQRQADKNQKTLSSVSNLDLPRSDLTFFPPDFFFLLPNLKSLYLDRNTLKTISFKLNRENHLSELNISHNQIHELPAEIKFFTKLQIFDVSHNNLSSIPESVYSLKNLEELDISENQIQALSQGLFIKKI